MDFLPKKIDNYIVNHSENETYLLKKLYKETWQKILNPRMLSGHFQGRVLSMLSKIKRPKNILEIGTYTGYSTLCLAEGLQKNGLIYTIDKNEELYGFAKKYFNKSPYSKNIKQYIGNGLDVIPTISKKFDLVFIDADKQNYVNYFNIVINKMNKGGIILSDNVLWSGKVVENLDPKDKNTNAILNYNKLLKESYKVETVILPIRDGISVSMVI